MLFADSEEMLSGHVANLFAAGEGEGAALDLKDTLVPRVRIDVERVAGEGEHAFAQFQAFTLAGGELGEDGDRVREGWEGW